MQPTLILMVAMKVALVMEMEMVVAMKVALVMEMEMVVAMKVALVMEMALVMGVVVMMEMALVMVMALVTANGGCRTAMAVDVKKYNHALSRNPASVAGYTALENIRSNETARP